MSVETVLETRSTMRKWRTAQFALKYSSWLALLGVIVIASLVSPSTFLSQDNIFNVLRQSSVNGILATGQTLVILTGGIDLSVGSLVAVSSVLCALYQVAHGGVLLPCLIGILACGAIGLLNGALVAKGKLPPFIVTLGMMGVARALAYYATSAQPVHGITEAFLVLGRGNLGSIPIPFILWIAVAICTTWFLANTPFGRSFFATGGHEEAARLSGLSPDATKVAAYVWCGMLAGLAGAVFTSRLSVGQPTAGAGFELDAIAAVVIGGAKLSGGEATIGGSVVGVILIGVLNNLMNLLGISPYIQTAIKGVIVIGAVYASMLPTGRKWRQLG